MHPRSLCFRDPIPFADIVMIPPSLPPIEQSPYAAQCSLEFLILFPQSPECWDDRYVPPHSIMGFLGMEPRVRYMLARWSLSGSCLPVLWVVTGSSEWYMGCIEVLRSMRSLDFNTRTQVTREAIDRLHEAVPGVRGSWKKKAPNKALASILGKSNLRFAGMSISVNISVDGLSLSVPATRQIIANHHMQSISFASGGDTDMTDYVAYVAKDPINQRACHILECCEGLAQSIISTVGQAFELRFKQYLHSPPKAVVPPERLTGLEEAAWGDHDEAVDHNYYNSIPGKEPPLGGLVDSRLAVTQPCALGTLGGLGQGMSPARRDARGLPWDLGPSGVVPLGDGYVQADTRGPHDCEEHLYVNTQGLDTMEPEDFSEAPLLPEDSPKKDLFDMRPFEDALKLHECTVAAGITAATLPLEDQWPSPPTRRAPIAPTEEQLRQEPWYHGRMSRRAAEKLLRADGDFLVRDSITNPGQYVLTGMHAGQPKHLLLVDPEGVVVTPEPGVNPMGPWQMTPPPRVQVPASDSSDTQLTPGHKCQAFGNPNRLLGLLPVVLMRKTNMWFLERLRGSGDNGASRGVGSEAGDKASKGPLYSNVLTPDKIPDFFIPPKLPSGPTEAEGQADLGPSTSEQNLASPGPRRAPRSPRLPVKLASESRSLLKAATRHVIQIESAEDWTAEEATNADPQAQGAMSLPSVPKAQTSYGFATLAESPHTRRKESLFHSEHGALAQVGSPGAGRRRGGAKANGGDGGSREAGGALMSPSRYFSGGESDTGSSAESSPFGSPLLSRSVSLLKGFAQDSQAKVSQLKHSVGRHGSLSADDSTPDTSPGVRRRLTRRATPEPGPESAQAPRGEHTVRMGTRGSVRLLAEYEAAQARLRVRLLAAEGLYDRPCDARSINCCVGLCLVPGKLQKQRSTIIKNSRHPIFNEDFFFDGLGPASVRKLSLRIKVVNKGSSLKRDTLLGEEELPLTSLLPFL
ncbi:hypothetical protein STEG23_003264 [Scotinomys teguina]